MFKIMKKSQICSHLENNFIDLDKIVIFFFNYSWNLLKHKKVSAHL